MKSEWVVKQNQYLPSLSFLPGLLAFLHASSVRWLVDFIILAASKGK